MLFVQLLHSCDATTLSSLVPSMLTILETAAVSPRRWSSPALSSTRSDPATLPRINFCRWYHIAELADFTRARLALNYVGCCTLNLLQKTPAACCPTTTSQASYMLLCNSGLLCRPPRVRMLLLKALEYMAASPASAQENVFSLLSNELTQPLAQRVLLPCLVWHSGHAAAAIRGLCMTLVSAFLQQSWLQGPGLQTLIQVCFIVFSELVGPCKHP